MEELLQLDKDVFLYLNSLGNETWDWFWVFITHKFAAIPMYVFLLYLLFKNYGWKRSLAVMVLIAAMITCTDQFANLFKDHFQRLRPCREDFINQARFLVDTCGKYGYFSGHAVSSMALAIFLGNIFKQWYRYALPALLAWALIVGYSRIYVGKHYPGDVLTGFVFGILIGWLFYVLQKWVMRRFFTN